jgi:mannose-1-phosphate guanylyltransferase
MLHALIMAGGSGTRFWPKSRHRRPKQFLTLWGERSLLQQAVDRLQGLVPNERIWVITGEAHRALTLAQLPALAPERIVGEPFGRDTAACIGLGAALITRGDTDATMLVMSADHLIEPADAFRTSALVASWAVETHPQSLLTFGIPPTFPATGYGYIQRGPEVVARDGVHVFRVEAFREKPGHDRAEQFLAAGNYLWNSGIFVWKAQAILDNLETNQLETRRACERIAAAWERPEREAIFRREYEPLQKISIDFAVMEKAREVLVVAAPYRWDDVGSWLALERTHRRDTDSNTVLASHCGLETKNCIIASDPGHLIATIGVRDLLIVQDGNATLVAARHEEAAVKQLVELMKQKGLEAYL